MVKFRYYRVIYIYWYLSTRLNLILIDYRYLSFRWCLSLFIHIDATRRVRYLSKYITFFNKVINNDEEIYIAIYPLKKFPDVFHMFYRAIIYSFVSITFGHLFHFVILHKINRWLAIIIIITNYQWLFADNLQC